MGYSRDTFYRVKRANEDRGFEALKEKSHRRPDLFQIRGCLAYKLVGEYIAIVFECPDRESARGIIQGVNPMY